MRSIFIFLFFLESMVIHAQTGNTITIGTRDSMYSNILHEDRHLWISMPDTVSPDGIFYPQRYPVVYLLDGYADNFSTVAVMLRQMGGGGGNTGFPQMILVAIPNTDRNRDLTPSHVDAAPGLDSLSAAHTGGGEKFISFIEKELIPHIDSLYPTAPYRLLIGHSFGGLTAIHILINHPDLFNAYLAIDPSMSWDHQKLLNQAKEVLQNKTFAGRSLFLAVANTMSAGMDTARVRNDTDSVNLHIRSILRLSDYLAAGEKDNGLGFDWKYYPDYDHGSVPLIAKYDGLRSIFKFYNFTIPFDKFFAPAYKGDSLISAHYKKLSRQMGYTVSPPEQLVGALAHQLLGLKQYERAFRFFQMNLENYPRSFNAYGAMGDFYADQGNKQKAADYYTKALQLRDDPEIRKKLERLR